MSTETTGAAPQDDEATGASTPQDGTPDGQARDAQDENLGKLNMEWKEKAAKWNKLGSLLDAYGIDPEDETALQRLNERLSRSPAAKDESVPEPVDPYAEVDFSEVKKWAAKGDATSILALKAYEESQKLRDENQRLVRGVEDAFTAREVEPKTRQRAVAHLNANRHRLGDFKAALAEVEASDLKAHVKRLEDQLARHQKPGVNPNAPSTHVADTPPGKPNNKPMKQSEFRAEIDRLRAEDKHDEVMALQRKRRLFEIEIVPG